MNTRYSLNKQKFLNNSEREHLEALLTRHKTLDFRNTTLIWTLLYSGGRAMEVLNLTASSLDTDHQTILILGLKGSNDREVPLPAWLFKRLLPLPRSAPPNPHEPLFGIGYDSLRLIWNNYRPCLKTVHSLRHTFAIDLFRRTKDLMLVKTALGHRSITNTAIYADYEYSTKELRRLITKTKGGQP